MFVHVTPHAGVVHFIAGLIAGLLTAWIILRKKGER